jgi:hypothetical protein
MLHPKAWLQSSAYWKRITVAGLLLAVAETAQAMPMYEFQFRGELTSHEPIAAFLQFEPDQLPSSVARGGTGSSSVITATFTFDSLTVYRSGVALGTDRNGIILQRDGKDSGLPDLYSVVSEPMGTSGAISNTITYTLFPDAIDIDPISPELTGRPMTDPGVFDGLMGAISLQFDDGSMQRGVLNNVTSRVITATNEPSTLLLFAAGFGGAGLLARRLRRRSR